MADRQYEYRGRDGRVYELQALTMERILDIFKTLYDRKVDMTKTYLTQEPTAEAMAEAIARDDMALLQCAAIVLLPKERYSVENIFEFIHEVGMNLPYEGWKQAIVDTYSAVMNMGIFLHIKEYMGVVDAELRRNPNAQREDFIALFDETGLPRVHRVK